MKRASRRAWAVRIVFAAVALHLAAGMALPFIVDWPVLNLYHQAIAGAFWGPYTVPAAAIARTSASVACSR